MDEKWEYMTQFIWADMNTEGVADFIKQRWPNWKEPPLYTPETMIPTLNSWGEKGWEIIHMQPVWLGHNHDLTNRGDRDRWTNVYFCVMKRRKQ